jgi:hypothetical protein
MHRTLLVAALVAAAGLTGLANGQALAEHEAESMRLKLEAILVRAAVDPPPKESRLVTDVSEREVNAYLRFVAGPDLPVGVVEPTIGIAESGRLSVRANIDLDAVRKSKSRGSLDPLSYVSGIVEIVLAGTLETSRGRGKFALESATLAGMTVPDSLVQELVTYLTRTADNPEGISLGQQFELPARIQQIRTRTGRATIVQ